MTTPSYEPLYTGGIHGPSDELSHICCPCNDDIAFCGTDVSLAVIVPWPPKDDPCVVCHALYEFPCPRCGQ